MSILDRALRLGEGKQFRQYAKRVERINAWEPELELLEDDELRAQTDSLRERARNGESLDELLPETFAVVRETSRRTLGMRPFDVQLIGGMVLHAGVLQNMQHYEEKRAAYAADITYGTNSEFGFDYLRDNMATSLEEKVQHGGRITEGKAVATHNFAIVDEVDNILI